MKAVTEYSLVRQFDRVVRAPAEFVIPALAAAGGRAGNRGIPRARQTRARE